MKLTQLGIRRAVLGGFAASVALVTLGSGVVPAAADPPGANGTVKIDGVPFDRDPDNQPHVGCRFQVDFYGFDQGSFNATVTFSVQPPTGPFTTILTDTVFVGQDPAGGGTDLDAQRTYNLISGLARYDAQPQQGKHVKLTVEAPGAGGSIATKHKVFWVGTCVS